jgi:hypothetical protein
MVKIELSNASNGIIKKVIDTQFNSVDQAVEMVKVYEISDTEPESLLDTIDILYELSEDLGLAFGSDHGPIQIKIDLDWGEEYSPSIEEIDSKIKILQSEVKALKEIKKTLIENDADNV